VIELIRSLLDRPLDPRHARAIVAVASCLTLGFAVLVAFGVIGGSRPSTTATSSATGPRPTAPPPDSVDRPPRRPAREPERSTTAHPDRRQDPQDRRGSAAYRRARRAVRDNRALQLLPFRRRGLSITLAGAGRSRAVIEIVAATVAEARHRWRGFLKRVDDNGSSYEVRFRAKPSRGER
jgi:hypothetical protein